jgi:hypothetical protein
VKSLADVLIFVSAIILAIPAWYANRFGHRVARMDMGGLKYGEPEFQAKYDQVVTGLKKDRDDWKPWKGWCFYIGTVLGLLAAALAIYTGVTEHAALPPPHT